MGRRGITQTYDKELLYRFTKKFSASFWVMAALGCLLLVSGMLLDADASIKDGFYSLAEKLPGVHPSFLSAFLSEELASYCGLVVTYNTILVAAVIFFYSIMDNRREGIPRRTIIAYTFGSYSVPSMFFVTMILVPVMYAKSSTGHTFTAAAMVIYVLALQLVILAMIMASTSFKFSVRAIKRVEIKQYNSEKKNSYTWLYWMHHLEQAVLSDEIIAEQIILVRDLLWVPYYRQGRFFEKGALADSQFTGGRPEEIYQFYFENLTAVFSHMREEGKRPERDRLYMALYEFLDYFSEWYRKLRRADAVDKNYLITVSGIMNAVLVSGLDGSDTFCNYVMNNCCVKGGMRTQLLGLYFLFQEALYMVDEKLLKLDSLADIEGLGEWCAGQLPDLCFFREFWEIWVGVYSFPKNKGDVNFRRAVMTLYQADTSSIPISYINMAVTKERGQYGGGRTKNVDKNFAAG